MKIRLLKDVPVDKKHGMAKGRIFEVLDRAIGRGRKWIVMGDVNEEIVVLADEADIVEE